MKIWAGSASTTPLLERPAQTVYRHMVAAGVLALLYPYPEVAVAGGALFGVGVVCLIARPPLRDFLWGTVGAVAFCALIIGGLWLEALV